MFAYKTRSDVFRNVNGEPPSETVSGRLSIGALIATRADELRPAAYSNTGLPTSAPPAKLARDISAYATDWVEAQRLDASRAEMTRTSSSLAPRRPSVTMLESTMARFLSAEPQVGSPRPSWFTTDVTPRTRSFAASGSPGEAIRRRELPASDRRQRWRFSQAVHGGHLGRVRERERVEAIGLIERGVAASAGPHVCGRLLMVDPTRHHLRGHVIAETVGLDEEVPDVVRRPIAPRARDPEPAGPVQEASRPRLKTPQAVDGSLHVTLHGLLAVVVEFDQFRQIELWKRRGRRLLDAPVGVADEIVEASLEVERRHRRDFQSDVVGPSKPVRLDVRFPTLARL